MEKKVAQKRIEDLRKLLEKHRILYHVHDAPVISDEAYDSLMQELALLEKKYPEYISPYSPTQRIGGNPIDSFSKVKHDVKQWSFDNAFSLTELKDWEERNQTLLQKAEVTSKPSYVAEMKIDGLKVILTYIDGKLVRAATRGNGEVGEDITENIKTVRSIPLVLPEGLSMTVIGEAWMKKKDLQRINKQREVQGLPLYANTRNLSAGTLRQLDPKIVATRNIQIYAYDIENVSKKGIAKKELVYKTQEDELEALERFGFLVNKDRKVCMNLQQIQSFYDSWIEKRHDEDYGIDGVVIKINERNLWDILGYTAKSPRGGVAYKFPAEEVTTQLLAITVQVGRTGAITPVAELSPVLLAGSVVSRATLHNKDEIERLDVRVGDTVLLRKAGDVIPEIFGVVEELRPKNTKAFVMPTRCPSCAGALSRISVGKELSVALYCTNKECPAQHLEGLIHFVSKKGANIDGLGEKILETFHDIGLITDIPSIYRLKKSDIEGLENFGEKSADNIIASINASRVMPFHRFLYSLGIRHVGEQTAKDIAKHFENFTRLKSATFEELSHVEGVGEKVGEELVAFFADAKNATLIQALEKEIDIEDVTRVADGPLFNKIFVITGTLPTLSREEAKEIIEKKGGKVASSISKRTNYLLAGENAGSKLDDAQKLGVEIIDEKRLTEMV